MGSAANGRDERDAREAPATEDEPPAGKRPTYSGVRSRLTTDLWFFWLSDQLWVDVELMTLNGTIAGVCPRSVSNGEILPIHRKYVPWNGTATWYLRITSGETEVQGLSIVVEFRDGLGRSKSAALCSTVTIPANSTLTLESTVEIPEELTP